MPTDIALQSGGGTGFGLLLLLVLFVAFVVMVVWTYQDAQRNSSQPAFLWAIVVFFAGIIGLVLYLFLGRNATGTAGGSAGVSNRY